MPNFNYPFTPNQNFPQQIQPVQNNGFIVVPSEEIAYNYPVAPNTCVTFKIEGQPIVMEKSMGMSPLESPKVKRYRLIEEVPEEQPVAKDALEDVWDAINEIKAQLESTKARRKKDGVAGDDE